MPATPMAETSSTAKLPFNERNVYDALYAKDSMKFIIERVCISYFISALVYIFADIFRMPLRTRVLTRGKTSKLKRKMLKGEIVGREEKARS